LTGNLLSWQLVPLLKSFMQRKQARGSEDPVSESQTLILLRRRIFCVAVASSSRTPASGRGPAVQGTEPARNERAAPALKNLQPDQKTQRMGGKLGAQRKEMTWPRLSSKSVAKLRRVPLSPNLVTFLVGQAASGFSLKCAKHWLLICK